MKETFQTAVISWFGQFLVGDTVPRDAVPVLTRLHQLYACWVADSFMGSIFAEGCPVSPAWAQRVRAEMSRLCAAVLRDAVPLVDAYAPPDFILGSAIGQADGRVYDNLWSGILATPDVLARPSWWEEFVRARSKL